MTLEKTLYTESSTSLIHTVCFKEDTFQRYLTYKIYQHFY